jgi:hypothetical protein
VRAFFMSVNIEPLVAVVRPGAGQAETGPLSPLFHFVNYSCLADWCG